MPGGSLARRVHLSLKHTIAGFAQAMRRHPTQAAALFTLTAIAIWLIFLGAEYAPDTYPRELAINFGAGLILTVITYTLLNRLVQSVVESRTRELPHFDKQYFLDSVHSSRNRIMILETWIGMMGGTAQAPGFFNALFDGLRRGVEVELYLLDPDSAAAKQRTEELNGQVNVTHEIMSCLRNMDEFASDKSTKILSKIRVYVGHEHPQLQVYSWDKRALITFYTREYRAYDRPQIETDLYGTPWGHYINERRTALFTDPRTYDFEDYLSREAMFYFDGEPQREERLRFVSHNDIFYIQDDQLTRLRNESRLQIDLRVFESNCEKRRYCLDLVTGPEVDVIRDLFQRKYDLDREVYFRLQPV